MNWRPSPHRLWTHRRCPSPTTRSSGVTLAADEINQAYEGQRLNFLDTVGKIVVRRIWDGDLGKADAIDPVYRRLAASGVCALNRTSGMQCAFKSIHNSSSARPASTYRSATGSGCCT